MELKTLIERANDGNVEAQFQLGEMYELNAHNENTFRKAIYWYMRAKVNGHIEASFKVDKMLWQYEGEFPLSFEE